MERIERAWAMRTSRDSEDHRRFVRSEIAAGRLRQGWGGSPEQDLRLVKARLEDKTVGWAGLTENEKWPWGHWRMLGELSANPDDAMKVGDVLLVPNLPENGIFTLCRLTGPYSYEIDPELEDFGHIRPVEVLTPGGVSFTNALVSGGLRRSLRCRSRLWWIGDHVDSLNAILAQVDAGNSGSLASSSDHAVRAQTTVAKELRKSLDSLALGIEAPLRASLQSAEWEVVLRDALVPLMRDLEVVHTGGPAEEGADLEIHIPNPFDPAEPWVIAVQVKDYDGQIGAHVAEQLEQAITSRRGPTARGTGRLVAVVLASTRASPSEELLTAMASLSTTHGVSISCVHGGDLMRVLARGLFMGYRDLPA